ncbi:hypothetical protein CFN78_23805 [Amycolatopsis antarctica]|uniref:Uncharacterized protein n=1 Tax=Amycolatopsis antarctica TaxID=1854586 RepID=A0A263CX22_9PSEU|nr:hypothetical protein CFN78_23805 [Amycolatopsis antarctica]
MAPVIAVAEELSRCEQPRIAPVRTGSSGDEIPSDSLVVAVDQRSRCHQLLEATDFERHAFVFVGSQEH